MSLKKKSRADLVTIIDGLSIEIKVTLVVETPVLDPNLNAEFAIFFNKVEGALYDRREAILAERLYQA